MNKKYILTLIIISIILIISFNVKAQSSLLVSTQTIIENGTLFLNNLDWLWLAVGDLTNDGNPDLTVTKGWENNRAGVAVFEFNNGIWNNGTLLEGPTLNNASNPVIAPIRNDNKNWLVYSEHLYGNGGEWLRGHRYIETALVENQDITARYGWPGWFAPGIGDVNQDGNLEIWVVTLQGSPTLRLRRHEWDPITNSYPGFELKNGGEEYWFWQNPIAADFLGDGSESLIWLSRSNTLDLVTFTPGTGINDHTSTPIITLSEEIRSYDSGEFDGNPGEDIAFNTWKDGNNSVYIVSGASFQITQVATGIDELLNVVQMGDLDGNGLDEIYFAGEKGGIYGYDPVSGYRILSQQPDVIWQSSESGNFEDQGKDEVYFGGVMGGRSFRIVKLSVENQPPTVDAGGSYTVEEGSGVLLTPIVTDPDGDFLTYAWSIDTTLCSFSAPTALNPTLTCLDNGEFNATLTVSDGGNDPVSDTALVFANNVDPVVGPIIAHFDLVAVDTEINTYVDFTDQGILDDHTAIWEWGDENTTIGVIIESGGSGSVTGLHFYTTPGVYTLKERVTDDDGGFGESIYQYIVVYDPDGGFVTGGGWFYSPPGAYIPDPTLIGKATFSFVSKYKKGTTIPTGNTEFQFKVADLNFHSSEYQWLVVAGDKAMFKGTGTINREGDYKFMISAIDGDIKGGEDMFRIKIWWEDEAEHVIYDNLLDAPEDADPTTFLEGGSIVIHKTK